MIVMDASLVVQILIWYIDDPKCVDIMPLYQKVTEESTEISSDDDREFCLFFKRGDSSFFPFGEGD